MDNSVKKRSISFFARGGRRPELRALSRGMEPVIEEWDLVEGGVE